ncbi:MAG: hypothetical protein II722_09680 [Ruminococcus sp.]|nr:hypothetical protein [Ruminococcus sp.]
MSGLSVTLPPMLLLAAPRIAHNPFLLVIPALFWSEMTIVLKRTEEKWLTELYGQQYTDYCKKVNRCIPWFEKK